MNRDILPELLYKGIPEKRYRYIKIYGDYSDEKRENIR
jgi:hypothetical protein